MNLSHKITILWLCSWMLLTFGSRPAQADLREDITQGYNLIDQWRFKEAEDYIGSLMKKYPQSGDVYFLKSRNEFYKGNYNRAWKLMENVEDVSPPVKSFKSLVENTREATAGFVTRESEHFIFRFSDGADQVLIHYAEEVLEKSYRVLGDILEYHPKNKVRVEIYPSRVPFSKISPLTLKDIVTSGTVALCKYNRIMIISPGSLVRGYNWMDTLSHEYIHYLLSSKSHNNVPLWLHEGIAKYLETRWRAGNNHLTPIMETILADGLGSDYLVALEDMMPSLAKLKTAEDVQLAYAEVATMVDYMTSLKGETVLAALVDELAGGTPIASILKNQFGKNLTEFQADWKTYVLGKKFKTIPGLTVLKFRFKDKRSTEEEQEALDIGHRRTHDLTLLGDILKSRQFIKAAIIEYRKAMAESATLSPILHNKLAGTYMLHQQFDKAEALLIESLQYYPMFTTTLANLGEVHFLQKSYQAALIFYKKAERINPFHPKVHARLIQIYAAQGREQEKEHQGQLYSYIK